MRILHFANAPATADQFKNGGKNFKTSGGWTVALLDRLRNVTDFEFAYVTLGKTSTIRSSYDDRIECFVIPQGWSEDGTALRNCRDLVSKWKPDLIHVHGTEGPYDLLTARRMVECPAVISLQGLLGPCSQWYNFFGNNRLKDILRMHRWLDVPALRGKWIEFVKLRKAAKRELEIIAGNRFFLGRTIWDRARIKAINPAVHYYHSDELLRDPFWHNLWDIKRAKRQRIMFVNAGHPRKGAEIMFEAIKLLQPNYPDIEVAIAGAISRRSGYGRYILKQIGQLGNRAVELGLLNAERMAKEFAKSHIFVSSSYIENSSNALCEAQLMGMPVIASYTGGIPSLIEDGRTGLFFPTGDAPMLAARIQQVLENDRLASQLGSQAREVAIKRHDGGKIVRDLLAVYEDVMRNTI